MLNASRYPGHDPSWGTNLRNPKIGAFYLATIPQFIPAGASPLVMGVALASILFLLGMVWAVLFVLGCRMAAARLRNPRAIKTVDRVTGSVLVAFGLKLALDPH